MSGARDPCEEPTTTEPGEKENTGLDQAPPGSSPRAPGSSDEL